MYAYVLVGCKSYNIYIYISFGSKKNTAGVFLRASEFCLRLDYFFLILLFITKYSNYAYQYYCFYCTHIFYSIRGGGVKSGKGCKERLIDNFKFIKIVISCV